MLAVNNAPLMAQTLDISEFTESYRDGQKLRQEYEARQQQKALNEIMKVGDHNGRVELAQQHKYAGALVPLVQKHEEDRQKAALDNLKTSSEIGKIYGETGKLGAETGEIGVKTMGQTIKNMIDKYSQISAGALTQNPQYFALMLGDFQNAGLINPEQKGSIIDMMMKDPENAAKVMQQLARGTIEGFKATAPEAKVLDGKDAAYMYTVDGFTGEAGQPTAKINYGQSPDNIADNDTRRYVSDNSLAGTQYSSDNSYEASIYGTDVRSGDSRYATDVASQDRQIKLNQDGKISWAKISQEQQKIDNPQVTNKPRAVAATKEMNKHLKNLKDNAHTLRNTAMWIKKIQSGELSLGAVSNMGNEAANRTGINGLGKNPAAYAEFKSSMVKLASDALRLNVGVQTDMDYKRALEEMQAGTYIPRNNKTAIALLNKISKDFESKNMAEYASYADYKREYDGVTLPGYGSGGKKTGSKKSKQSKGGSIIGGILGGG